MAKLSPDEIEALKNKVSSDPKVLRKLYISKKKEFHEKTIEHNLAEEFFKDGWEEYGNPLKYKIRIRKKKVHSEQFEDDIWCQLYDLGFTSLNTDREFSLPYGRNVGDRKQIDILAVKDDAVLVIECKSSAKIKKAPSYKTEFEALAQRIRGQSESLRQLFGDGKKAKFIFATRNLRLSRESTDGQRLADSNCFHYSDNTYDYVNSLIKSYKDAAQYQFMAMLFKGQSISSTKIEVPAIEGKMGNKTYYMFSLEPSLLLKLGFVLHRTRVNEAEMPTYQRLLVPSRLKGIGKYIDEGGYFPNSVILNFTEKKRQKIQFEAAARCGDSQSRAGILKIPDAYAVAYIIDGQHRIYGYSQSNYKNSNTIPVVAFKGLESREQLEMFVDINENQKAVSPTLRITLEEDLYWNASRLDSRMKALRSSVVSTLGGEQSSPLFGKIAIGEDKAKLSAKPFYDALIRCGLLPEAKGNKFTEQDINSSLYDTNNHDHLKEMDATKVRVVQLLTACYEFAEEDLANSHETLDNFIVYNRGTYAFISLIGNLNKHLTQVGEVDFNTPTQQRFEAIEKYLQTLFNTLKNISDEDKSRLQGTLGSGANNTWLRMFQDYVNKGHKEYVPSELLDWRERQDQELQKEGREIGTKIERHMKKVVINNLEAVYGSDWELEIGAIQRECEKRAKEQMERSYKEGLAKENIPWTDMFNITDYKKIIDKYWAKSPDSETIGYKTFEQHFALDVGHGFTKKAEKVKWISQFNSHRNNWAHEGTKEKGLNREEVQYLRNIATKLNL